jgi:hypothetical protein
MSVVRKRKGKIKAEFSGPTAGVYFDVVVGLVWSSDPES